MKTVGMFEAKSHLAELIKQVESGEELCITNRGREEAFIIPVEKYYKNKFESVVQSFLEFKKNAPIGSVKDIINMKEEGKK